MASIQCVLCGRTFNRIPESHTKKVHDITLKDYQKKYGPVTAEEASAQLATIDKEITLFEAASRGMSPEELTDLQAATRLRVFSRQKRYASIYASYGVMQARLNHFQKSAELASRVQEKLCDESWRLDVDIDGKPVSTQDLLDIGRYAQTDMKNAGEVILRLLGQVVQDNKAVVTRPGAVEHSAFTGDYDNVPLPDVPGHEREKIRIFMENLCSMVEAQRGTTIIEGEIQDAHRSEEPDAPDTQNS